MGRITTQLRQVTIGMALILTASVQAELPAEPIPNVETLQVPYPSSYAVVHDFAFGSLTDSSFALVDTKTRRFKGMLSAGQFATFDYSLARQEFYVGETVYSRGTRGTRQDVIAIYDFANMALVGEVNLPPKRMNVVVNHAATGLTADGRFFLVMYMSPATSVAVIDLERRTLVSEIPLPGCSFVYPDLQRGFISLCGNGTMLSVKLDEAGKELTRESSAPFNDIDADPLSEKAALINGVWYFVTYGGAVQPIDVNGAKPVVGERWWLTTPDERAANWRPAGWHGRAGHDSGRLWVGMTPDGYTGSHKDPAPEVWLFSVENRNNLQRFPLRVPALSIAVSKGADPELLVVNVNGQLDVYDALTGVYRHSINALGETPYMVHTID